MHILLGPHKGKIIAGFGGSRRIERDRFLKKIGGLVEETGLFRGGSIIEVESGIRHFGGIKLGFVQGFFEGGHGFLRVLGFTQGDGEVIDHLGRFGKAPPRFGQHLDRPIGVLDRAQQQFRQTDVGNGVIGINQQALLVVGRGPGKGRLGLCCLIFPQQGTPLVVQNLGQQIVGLIFLGVLLDDLLQHLDGLALLIG